jgi:hypothetical protein
LHPGRPLTIGRDADLSVDDNQYLHRHFLRIEEREGLWWLANVGTQLTATVSDELGAFQAYLAPGAHIPLVFPATTVRFSAGATTYEFVVHSGDAVFDPPQPATATAGETTAGAPTLNRDQMLLLLALSERALRSSDRSISGLPSSQEAAARLGWSLPRFNRKLDYLCQKLTRLGVRGLHGRPEKLASNRRFRLVEYALAARLVTAGDLTLLDSDTPE